MFPISKQKVIVKTQGVVFKVSVKSSWVQWTFIVEINLLSANTNFTLRNKRNAGDLNTEYIRLEKVSKD